MDTRDGERMRFEPDALVPGLEAQVVIFRPGAEEILTMARDSSSGIFQSVETPAEPHEFKAELRLGVAGAAERLPFSMSEPHAH